MSKNNPVEPVANPSKTSPPEELDQAPARCPLRKWATQPVAVPELLLVSLFVLSLMGYWEGLGWPADLASHFKVQYAIFQALCLLIVIVRKKPQWVLVALLGLGMNLAEIAPFYLKSNENAAGLSSIPSLGQYKIMQMNVLTKNTQHDKAIQAIHTMNPDIIAFNEVDTTWMEAVRPALNAYPHHVESLRNDNFGIALYSKIPFLKTKVHTFGDVVYGIPSLLAAIQITPKTTQNKNDKAPLSPAQVVTILATHPLPPTSPEYYNARNQQLNNIAEARLKNELGRHMIVVGDLNTTPYSETYKMFLTFTGLQDTRSGFGLHPTWPSAFMPLWIPIDHILVSDAFSTVDFQRGPDIGSDHRPIMATVKLLDLPELDIMPTSAPTSNKTDLSSKLQKAPGKKSRPEGPPQP